MIEDPRALFARSAIRPLQAMAIIMCVLLNALDGFDVLSISFAAPGIAAEWQIDRAALGFVLSMELLGMAAGSILFGQLADRAGRRPVMIGCLVIMATGMWLATRTHDLPMLAAFRLFTGLGVGGMLACATTMVSELANDRIRNLAVSAMAAGYPLGAVVGGSFASFLLANGGWRDVFLFGALVSTAFIPLTWFLLPESVSYLAQARPAGALDKINAILTRFGHPTLSALPAWPTLAAKSSIGQLFSAPLIATTTLLTLAYFSQMLTYYFILKWVPKIVVDMGYTPSVAGAVLVSANFGGLVSGFVVSLLSLRIRIKPLTIAMLMLSMGLVTLFGQSHGDLMWMTIIVTIAGFCSQGAVNGLFAIIAHGFPTVVRAGGTGFVFGCGRGGAAIGPILAGWLFSFSLGLPLVAFVMALGSLIAVTALMMLPSLQDPETSTRKHDEMKCMENSVPADEASAPVSL